MQIHELDYFAGELGSSSYIAVDNGTDTGKLSTSDLLKNVNQEIDTLDETLNDRIDNIIGGGTAPSAAEVTDARLGAADLGGLTYASLGAAIRAQVTDLNSDTINQGKKLIDKKTPVSLLVGWTIGEWQYNTGTINTNVKSRVSSTEDYTTDGAETFYIDTGFSLFVSKKTGNSYSYDGWKTGSVVLDGTYRFIIRDDNNGGANADISNSTRKVYAGISPLNDYVEKIYLDPRAYTEFKHGVSFIAADIVSNAGANFGKLGNNKYRLSTTNILKYNYDLKIEIGSGYKFCYYLYESTTSETAIPASNSQWIRTDYIMPAGTCFRIQIAKDPEDYVTITDPIDNDFYRSLTLSVYESEEENNEIPGYWVDEIAAKETTINTANEALGKNGVSFVFLTDYHQSTSNHASTPLIRHIFDNTSTDVMIYGGDTTDGIGTAAQCLKKIREYAESVRQFDCLNVRGNHDCEPTANSTVNQISDAKYYDACIRNLEKFIDTGKRLYYHYDNITQKVRYIILDSGGMNDPLDSAQMSWLKARLTELGTGWTVIIFQHVMIEQNSNNQTVHMSGRGQTTLDAIGTVYSSLDCKIAAIICGHAHVDAIVSTNYNFKIIATTCDSGGANAAYDWNNPTRTAGTTEECAFDVFSIDTANRTIKITRIGAGSDRSETY